MTGKADSLVKHVRRNRSSSLWSFLDVFLKFHESLVLREDHQHEQRDFLDGVGENSSC